MSHGDYIKALRTPCLGLQHFLSFGSFSLHSEMISNTCNRNPIHDEDTERFYGEYKGELGTDNFVEKVDVENLKERYWVFSLFNFST